MLNKTKSFAGVDIVYLIIIALVCLFYALLFRPVGVEAGGDTDNYITLAKQFLGTDSSQQDLSNRSPFYSVILAVFIKIFGEGNFLQFVFYFQCLLLFLSAALLYKIFNELLNVSLHPGRERKSPGHEEFQSSAVESSLLPRESKSSRYILLLIGLMFLFNISTITYGFMILTETLTLFLFICTAYLIVRYPAVRRKKGVLVLAGLLTGLLILTRFNTLLLPLCLIFCFFLAHYFESGWKKTGVLLVHISLFILPLLVVLNIWCYKNYRDYGFYSLFPPSYGSQRFLEPALVNEDTEVSPQYRQVLDIFLRAKEKILSKDPPLKKGSLLKYIPIKRLLYEINAGYKIYKEARSELLVLFQVENAANPEFLLGRKLTGFYKEVAAQNKLKLFLFRVYSLLNSFRAGFVTLPSRANINLNVLLPAFIFVLYKIMFLFLMVLFVPLTFFYLVHIIKGRRIKENYIQICLLVLIFYFPAINFLAVTIADATRFKYPAEPLIFGMLVYYVYYYSRLRRKKKLLIKPTSAGESTAVEIEDR